MGYTRKKAREHEKQSASFYIRNHHHNGHHSAKLSFRGCMCVSVEMMMVYMMFYFCPIHDKYIE
jgi:hypothetical protein